MKYAVIAAVLALAAACSAPVLRFDKPGAQPADFQRDTYECERDARSAFGPQYGVSPHSYRFTIECMRARGYTYAGVQ